MKVCEYKQNQINFDYMNVKDVLFIYILQLLNLASSLFNYIWK
jgi:hypothetical protein